MFIVNIYYKYKKLYKNLSFSSYVSLIQTKVTTILIFVITVFLKLHYLLTPVF